MIIETKKKRKKIPKLKKEKNILKKFFFAKINFLSNT